MENKTENEALGPRLAVVNRPAPRSFSLMPSSLGEAMELARMIADSDMAPKDYQKKPANIIIAIQMGADVGLKPMQALQNIAIINGRPSIWGDAALALCMDYLDDVPIEKVEGKDDARVASCTIKRKGFPTPVTRTFSVADAKKAGLWTKPGPWATYPERMLQMRARGFALRDSCADCLMGLVLAEEAQDYPAPGTIDVSPMPNAQLAVPPALEALGRLPAEVRQGIEKAFVTLNLGVAADAAAVWHPTGAGLAKLNEFLGEGNDGDAGAAKLLEWCRDEYAARQGRKREPAKTDNGKKTAEPAKTAAPAAAEAPKQAELPNAPAADEIFKKEPVAAAAPAKDFVGF